MADVVSLGVVGYCLICAESICWPGKPSKNKYAQIIPV
jgi:hypothetical protein